MFGGLGVLTMYLRLDKGSIVLGDLKLRREFGLI